jgi:ribosomal protein S18 acetylase RimI-like enzyme
MVPDPVITYRPGNPNDVPAIIALLTRCDATMAEWAPAGWVAPTTAVDTDRLAQRMSDPATGVTVADLDGRVVGFSTFRQGDTPGRGQISNLFVDPDHWGAGIGRGLLARAEQGMRERGLTVGQLNTQTLNARARRLYERAGWRDTGGRHPHDEDGLEMAEYEREL